MSRVPLIHGDLLGVAVEELAGCRDVACTVPKPEAEGGAEVTDLLTRIPEATALAFSGTRSDDMPSALGGGFAD